MLYKIGAVYDYSVLYFTTNSSLLLIYLRYTFTYVSPALVISRRNYTLASLTQLRYTLVQQTLEVRVLDRIECPGANTMLLPSQSVLSHRLPWIVSLVCRRPRAQRGHAWESRRHPRR